jgi:hypothetical protein
VACRRARTSDTQLPTSSLEALLQGGRHVGDRVLPPAPVTPSPRIRLLCTLAVPLACGRKASWMSFEISA